jgi:hypothetical protein
MANPLIKLFEQINTKIMELFPEAENMLALMLSEKEN